MNRAFESSEDRFHRARATRSASRESCRLENILTFKEMWSKDREQLKHHSGGYDPRSMSAEPFLLHTESQIWESTLVDSLQVYNDPFLFK